jgi:hypothetical protein
MRSPSAPRRQASLSPPQLRTTVLPRARAGARQHSRRARTRTKAPPLPPGTPEDLREFQQSDIEGIRDMFAAINVVIVDETVFS